MRALADAGQARREDVVPGRLQLAPDVAEAVRAAPGAVHEDERRHRAIVTAAGRPRARRDADAPAHEQRRDDAAPQDEQRDRGGGEHADLPRLAQREGERDRRAQDRADRGRAGAVEERAGPRARRAGAGSARRRAG